MKLSSLSTFYFALSSLLLVSILGTVVLMLDNQSKLVDSQEIRYQSHLAADELRQSADDLTRLARTYVVTGEERYEQQFGNVLAIRDGLKPRPDSDTRLDRDLGATVGTSGAVGPATSLQEQMQALGFSDQEMALLAEATQDSNELVTLEYTAMNTFKGLFADDAGGFTRQGQPDPELARNLLFSAEYEQQQARIMRSLDELHVSMDERTELMVAEHIQRSSRYFMVLLALLALAIITATVSFLRIRHRFTRPVRSLSAALKTIAEGSDGHNEPLDSSGSDELADVARYFNRVSARFAEALESVKRETEFAKKLHRAFDASSASIVVADESNKVIYSNKSARRALKVAEADLKLGNPQFSADHLEDSCWNELHPDPAMRSVLQNLDSRHEEFLTYQDYSFRLTANPVVSEDGTRHGVIAELQDITSKVEMERQREIEIEERKAKEINDRVDVLLDIVNSAVHGDLTRPMSITGDDVVARMGKGIESLLNELRSNLVHIRSSSQALQQATGTLAGTSDEIDHMTIQASRDMISMAETSTAMKGDVDSVTSAMEQMSVAITHIALNAGEAADVANQAVKLAESTDSTVRQLSVSSTDIGNILKVITSIAEQTNLLALNATIEAARAGDAGKGFAVVANEVKELAKETAKATEQIGNSIEAIQTNSSEAVEAITSIGYTIKRISTIQNVIASAVREQTSSTTEMSVSVHSAASNGDRISEKNNNLADGINQTKQGVTRLQSVSGDISGLADELRKRVEKFELGDSSAQNGS